ncbi:MAG: DRTGG domain-containing protein [Oscillospiraceae bacterium]
MLLREVIGILDAEVIYGEDMLDVEIRTACGSDLMSDVLAFVKDQGMLLTGLMNQQVVRTADMLDMRCIVFVRGKTPEEDLVELAKDRGIALLSTKCRMFTACGKLYEAGLGGGCETSAVS